MNTRQAKKQKVGRTGNVQGSASAAARVRPVHPGKQLGPREIIESEHLDADTTDPSGEKRDTRRQGRPSLRECRAP